MKFRLIFEGAIPPRPRTSLAEIHVIRTKLAPQLQALWTFDTTIGTIDMTKDERAAARKARKRQAKREKRRKQGIKPRAEYEASAIGHGKPWEAEGVSKATWYKRQRTAKQ
jgi:hypothetical protein